MRIEASSGEGPSVGIGIGTPVSPEQAEGGEVDSVRWLLTWSCRGKLTVSIVTFVGQRVTGATKAPARARLVHCFFPFSVCSSPWLTLPYLTAALLSRSQLRFMKRMIVGRQITTETHLRDVMHYCLV